MPRMSRDQQIDRAIALFNFNPPWDDFHGRKVAHHARRPILATDCDYEVVSVSGVQGVRLPS
jgi:hypothetical protein